MTGVAVRAGVWHCWEPRRLAMRTRFPRFPAVRKCRATPAEQTERITRVSRTSALLAIVESVSRWSIDSIASSATPTANNAILRTRLPLIKPRSLNREAESFLLSRAGYRPRK